MNRSQGDGAIGSICSTHEAPPSGEGDAMTVVETRTTEDEKKKVLEEELKQIKDFIAEAEERISYRSKLREENTLASENHPDESFFSKLDSNLKKTTAFVKKLKTITENQKDSLIKDFNTFNLTKYIGEIASALVDAKLKMSDINCVLKISSLIHQRYSDFSPTFLEHWQRNLISKKDEKVANMSKLRVDLRLFADLICIGIFPEKEALNILANQLTFLTSNDKDEFNNLSIIISFCRHCGDDYAGLVSQKVKELAEKHNMDIPNSQFLKSDRQKACRSLLKDYFSALSKHVIGKCKELRSYEKQNKKIFQSKGELSSERKDRCENLQQNFQKLHQNISTFADLLGKPLPDLPEEEMESETAGQDAFFTHRCGEASETLETGLFEDEDTRQFYESLPDLKSLIPGILYKDSEHPVTNSVDTHTEEDLEITDDIVTLVDETKEFKLEDGGSTNQEVEKQTNAELESTVDHEEDDCNTVGSMKAMLETFLNNLPNCINRELIDKAAIDFCMNLNTKSNRRKLVKALFSVHRTRYDLLPFYSRLVATLHPCMPSISSDLGVMLKGDFRFHMKKKDQINIESKLKVVRFIGELTKFNMIGKPDTMYCLKLLLTDFTHHNIEMACTLLETCGRFLYRSSDSYHRMKIYLDVMMRKKLALHLDSRYVTMIENAFYYSNPPENNRQETQKCLPPMFQYIERLLYKDLTKVSVEKVLRQMRKLYWNDAEVKVFATKSLSSVWKVRYNCIHCCANLLSGLAAFQEEISIHVIDSVLENIRIGMETILPKFNQRRLSTVKYLGEMYNFRLVESQVIFRTLYSFITFETSLDASNPSPLDPPENLFRIRLVHVLLETCGQYFERGPSRKKLDCFLIYFQRYFWSKRSSSIWAETCPFPTDIDNLVSELFDSLRPKMVPFKSCEEANEAACNLDEEYKKRVCEFIKMHQSNEAGEFALGTIHESESEDIGDDDNANLKGSHDSDPDLDRESFSLSQKEDNDTDNEVILSSQETDMPVMTGKLKLIKCQEDDEFLSAFDKMLTESIQTRQQEITKTPAVEIAVPFGVKAQSRVKSKDTNKEDGNEEGAIPFTVLTRKGNKQQFATLIIPITETLAARFKEQKKIELEEKEKMKRVVLEIHERQEEEHYQAEMLAQMMKNNQQVPGSSREKKSNYQHPKGAPDADSIFGFKRR